jgi:hypothetical protein
METHNSSEIVVVLGIPCAIPPLNSNSNDVVKIFITFQLFFPLSNRIKIMDYIRRFHNFLRLSIVL